jgi:hypothetical protein
VEEPRFVTLGLSNFGNLSCRLHYRTLINDALLEYVHCRSTLDIVRQAVRDELARYSIARGVTQHTSRSAERTVDRYR